MLAGPPDMSAVAEATARLQLDPDIELREAVLRTSLRVCASFHPLHPSPSHSTISACSLAQSPSSQRLPCASSPPQPSPIELSPPSLMPPDLPTYQPSAQCTTPLKSSPSSSLTPEPSHLVPTQGSPYYPMSPEPSPVNSLQTVLSPKFSQCQNSPPGPSTPLQAYAMQSQFSPTQPLPTQPSPPVEASRSHSVSIFSSPPPFIGRLNDIRSAIISLGGARLLLFLIGRLQHRPPQDVACVSALATLLRLLKLVLWQRPTAQQQVLRASPISDF